MVVKSGKVNVIFVGMKATESVKISKEVVDMVRANKAVTGVSVGVFFEMAAKEKLKKTTKK